MKWWTVWFRTTAGRLDSRRVLAGNERHAARVARGVLLAAGQGAARITAIVAA
jgi:hypothetical protein